VGAALVGVGVAALGAGVVGVATLGPTVVGLATLCAGLVGVATVGAGLVGVGALGAGVVGVGVAAAVAKPWRRAWASRLFALAWNSAWVGGVQRTGWSRFCLAAWTVFAQDTISISPLSRVVWLSDEIHVKISGSLSGVFTLYLSLSATRFWYIFNSTCLDLPAMIAISRGVNGNAGDCR
jgi:hypothetical protein